MTLLIAPSFLIQVFVDGLSHVDTGLVGDTHDDEEDVGEFVGKIRAFVGILEALFAVQARH